MRKEPKSETRSKDARHRFKKPRKPPECRHEIQRRGHIVNLAAPGITTLFREHMTTTIVVDVKICTTCKAWLSLGHSNESPAAVKVEIRAAELVSVRLISSAARWKTATSTIVREVRRQKAKLKTRIVMTLFERWGWICHQDGTPHGPHEDPGWLAREIFTHDECNARDAEAWPWNAGRTLAWQYEEHVLSAKGRLCLASPGWVPHTKTQLALPVDMTPLGHVEIDLIEGGEPEQGVELELVVGDDPSCPHPEDQVERDRVATESHRCGMVWPTVPSVIAPRKGAVSA